MILRFEVEITPDHYDITNDSEPTLHYPLTVSVTHHDVNLIQHKSTKAMHENPTVWRSKISTFIGDSVLRAVLCENPDALKEGER